MRTIQVTNTRVSVNDPNYQHETKFKRSVESAIIGLLKYELGFGGQLHAVDKTSITTKTRVMGWWDYSEVSGSEEDMQHIFQAVNCFIQAQKKFGDDTREKIAQALVDQKATALIMTTLAPVLVGQELFKKALLIGLGVDEEEAVLLKSIEDENELIAVLELKRELGLPLSEILEEVF